MIEVKKNNFLLAFGTCVKGKNKFHQLVLELIINYNMFHALMQY